MYNKCAANGGGNDTCLETAPKMDQCVSTTQAAADRGSGRPGNCGKHKKKRLVSKHAPYTRKITKKVPGMDTRTLLSREGFESVFFTFWTPGPKGTKRCPQSRPGAPEDLQKVA